MLPRARVHVLHDLVSTTSARRQMYQPRGMIQKRPVNDSHQRHTNELFEKQGTGTSLVWTMTCSQYIMESFCGVVCTSRTNLFQSRGASISTIWSMIRFKKCLSGTTSTISSGIEARRGLVCNISTKSSNIEELERQRSVNALRIDSAEFSTSSTCSFKIEALPQSGSCRCRTSTMLVSGITWPSTELPVAQMGLANWETYPQIKYPHSCQKFDILRVFAISFHFQTDFRGGFVHQRRCSRTA